MRFSVDARLVAEALQKDMYVIADYYYIPWALRFYNLCSYGQPGDVLILSLEFSQYIEQYHVLKIFGNVLRKKDPGIYSVLGLYCDYINSLGCLFGINISRVFCAFSLAGIFLEDEAAAGEYGIGIDRARGWVVFCED